MYDMGIVVVEKAVILALIREGVVDITRRSCTGWGCPYLAPCSRGRLRILCASLSRQAGTKYTIN